MGRSLPQRASVRMVELVDLGLFGDREEGPGLGVVNAKWSDVAIGALLLFCLAKGD